jgi:hypothetical protein
VRKEENHKINSLETKEIVLVHDDIVEKDQFYDKYDLISKLNAR